MRSTTCDIKITHFIFILLKYMYKLLIKSLLVNSWYRDLTSTSYFAMLLSKKSTVSVYSRQLLWEVITLIPRQKNSIRSEINQWNVLHSGWRNKLKTNCTNKTAHLMKIGEMAVNNNQLHLHKQACNLTAYTYPSLRLYTVTLFLIQCVLPPLHLNMCETYFESWVFLSWSLKVWLAWTLFCVRLFVNWNFKCIITEAFN